MADIQKVSQTVEGVAAHDAAAAENPVTIGARANLNEPAVVADADNTYVWADLFGRIVVLAGHPNPEDPLTINATASGDTNVIGTPGASLSLHICKVSVHNRGATPLVVSLQEDAAAVDFWKAELAANGGGSLIDFGNRGWKLAANTGLDINLAGAGDIDINVTEYYIAA